MIQDIIYELEQKLGRAVQRTDQNFLDKTIADSFIEFGSSGQIFTKADIITLLSTETIFTDYSLENFSLTKLSDDTVHVTYQIPSRTLGNGTVRKGSLRSSIWSRAGDNWQLRFHQGTLLP